MIPKFCRDCIHSKPDVNSPWTLQCHNDKVNAVNEYSLSSTKNNGCSTLTERSAEWYHFPVCGKAGKMFSPIDDYHFDNY